MLPYSSRLIQYMLECGNELYAKSGLSARIIFADRAEKTGSMIINKIKSLVLTTLLFIPYQMSKPILSKVKGALGNRIRFVFSGAGALPSY